MQCPLTLTSGGFSRSKKILWGSVDIPDHIRRKVEQHQRDLDRIRDRERVLGPAYAATVDSWRYSALEITKRTQGASAIERVAIEMARERAFHAPRQPLIEWAQGKFADPSGTRSLYVEDRLRQLLPPQSRALEQIERGSLLDRITRQAHEAVLDRWPRQPSELLSAMEKKIRLADPFEMPGVRAALIASRMPGFESTVLGRFQTRVQELADQDAGAAAIVHEVRSLLRSRVAESAHDCVSYLSSPQFLLSLIVSILITYFQLHVGEQQSREMTKRLEDLVHTVRGLQDEMAQLRSAQPTQEPTDLNVVLGTAYVRADRRDAAPKIALVFPNQIVRLVRVSKTWAYVEFEDHIEGSRRAGWIYKKVLQKPRHQTSGCP